MFAKMCFTLTIAVIVVFSSEQQYVTAMNAEHKADDQAVSGEAQSVEKKWNRALSWWALKRPQRGIADQLAMLDRSAGAPAIIYSDSSKQAQPDEGDESQSFERLLRKALRGNRPRNLFTKKAGQSRNRPRNLYSKKAERQNRPRNLFNKKAFPRNGPHNLFTKKTVQKDAEKRMPINLFT